MHTVVLLNIHKDELISFKILKIILIICNFYLFNDRKKNRETKIKMSERQLKFCKK